MTQTPDCEQDFDLALNDLDTCTDEQLMDKARSAFLQQLPIYENSKRYEIQVVVIRQQGKATATVRAFKK